MAKENKKSATDNKQTCYDIRGNEINDPYEVLAIRLTFKMEEIRTHIESRKDPKELLEAYVLGRNLDTLMSALSEIYGSSLKNVDLPNTSSLNQLMKNNERYKNELEKKLLQNKEMNSRVLCMFSEKKKDYFTKEAYERHKKFLSECYDFTKKNESTHK